MHISFILSQKLTSAKEIRAENFVNNTTLFKKNSPWKGHCESCY